MYSFIVLEHKISKQVVDRAMFLWKPLEKDLSLLFQLLVSPSDLWLIAANFQTLPSSLHGHLLPVYLHITSLLCVSVSSLPSSQEDPSHTGIGAHPAPTLSYLLWSHLWQLCFQIKSYSVVLGVRISTYLLGNTTQQITEVVLNHQDPFSTMGGVLYFPREDFSDNFHSSQLGQSLTFCASP